MFLCDSCLELSWTSSSDVLSRYDGGAKSVGVSSKLALRPILALFVGIRLDRCEGGDALNESSSMVANPSEGLVSKVIWNK